jgi:NADH-quinone oxidoreductase subunit G
MLDAERCILCSRCVRFCDEITSTGELGIFNRGDHSEIGLFPGTTLDNGYTGNVIDICPVGALTDRDFRFQVRVWYLDATRSVCPGCARGCNIEIHTSRSRPHHNQGRRVARLKPRYNPDVNRWWMCDGGRYGFRWIDDDTRITAPRAGRNGRAAPTTWEGALATLAEALGRHGPDAVGILASPDMSNEDLYALGELARHLSIANVDFRVPPRHSGVDDDVLIRADKHPNRRGAEACLRGGGLDARGMLDAAAAGRIRLLWVMHHDLFASAWPEAAVRAALEGVETLVFQGPTGHAVVAEAAHVVLPSAAYAERDGTFTNFEGRVQRFRAALTPLGEALPDWAILGRLGRMLGAAGPAFAAERAERVFAALAAAVPGFSGMSYRALGDRGLVLAP